MNPAATFDFFAPGAGPLVVLFGSRVTGLMLVAPMFAARPIPPMMRAGILVTLVVLMLPVVSPVGSATMQATIKIPAGVPPKSIITIKSSVRHCVSVLV